MSNHYNDPLTDVEPDAELHPFRKRHAQQLRALFGSMPYGGVCQFTRVDTLDEAIANLTSLRDRMIEVAESNQRIEDEYRGLVADVAALGRLFGTGDSRIAAAKLLGFDPHDVTPAPEPEPVAPAPERSHIVIVTLNNGEQLALRVEPDHSVSWVAERPQTHASWGIPLEPVADHVGPGTAGTYLVRAEH